MKNNKIAITVAMRAEYQGLAKVLPEYNIIQTGIGQINSVFTLTKFLSKNKVLALINIGLAGGYSENIHVGDLIISDKFFNANSYMTHSHKLGSGTHFEEWTFVDWKEGENEKESQGLLADRELLSQFEIFAKENHVQKFHIGNIWSGDIWNKEIDTINAIRSKYDTLCEDMESFAIKAICDKFNIPMISIKIVSNNELIGEPYNKSVVPILQNTVTNFIKFIDS